MRENTIRVKENSNQNSVQIPVTILQDLDYSNVNMKFSGTVIIKGRISPGLKIKATHDVIVEKKIKHVIIEAGRNIVLKQGVDGYAKAYLKAEKNIYSKKMVEAANLVAGNDVVVEDMILHSKVTALNQVVVNGDIIGGITKASSLIKADSIGSYGCVKTILDIGNKDSVKESFNNIQKRISETKKNLLELRGSIKYLRAKYNELDESYVIELETFIQSLESNLRDQERKKEKLVRVLNKISEGKVVLNQAIHKGVELKIKGLDKKMNKTYSFSQQGAVYTDEDKIIIDSLVSSVLDSVEKKIKSLESQDESSNRENNKVVNFLQKLNSVA